MSFGPRLPRLAAELMEEFAVATGLTGEAPPRRYLWTDAFAVTNFLGLHRATGEGRWLDLALRLVDQVHHVLGRHRTDGAVHGWISGLADRAGEEHPTLGGLRIGKPLPERRVDEPADDRLEWERDGQYFHYLAQWMHALARAGKECEQPLFHRWAVELARTAHAHFVVRDLAGAPVRMAWKMSIALDRPLVSAMGQHDPLDAWLAYREIAKGAVRADEPPALAREIEEARALCAFGDWTTSDPLGAGALLVALHRVDGLEASGVALDDALVARLAAAAEESLAACVGSGVGTGSVRDRLAFRELGLAIGIHAVEALATRADEVTGAISRRLPALLRNADLAARLDERWSAADARRSPLWRPQGDINGVMLATSLAPEGYLGPV